MGPDSAPACAAFPSKALSDLANLALASGRARRCGSTRCADKAVQSAPTPPRGSRTRTLRTSSWTADTRRPSALCAACEDARGSCGCRLNSILGRRGYDARGQTRARAGVNMRCPAYLSYPPEYAGVLARHGIAPNGQWTMSRTVIVRTKSRDPLQILTGWIIIWGVYLRSSSCSPASTPIAPRLGFQVHWVYMQLGFPASSLSRTLNR